MQKLEFPLNIFPKSDKRREEAIKSVASYFYHPVVFMGKKLYVNSTNHGMSNPHMEFTTEDGKESYKIELPLYEVVMTFSPLCYALLSEQEYIEEVILFKLKDEISKYEKQKVDQKNYSIETIVEKYNK